MSSRAQTSQPIPYEEHVKRAADRLAEVPFTPAERDLLALLLRGSVVLVRPAEAGAGGHDLGSER
ncbi:hypothetical protein [Geodermatophilus sp. URMC 62]|uniref:hypothetical protein n=1 Tax=Geodermatophilus sp. URMC 62 TaxID=3423414 RepID=UPI00406CEB94